MLDLFGRPSTRARYMHMSSFCFFSPSVALIRISTHSLPTLITSHRGPSTLTRTLTLTSPVRVGSMHGGTSSSVLNDTFGCAERLPSSRNTCDGFSRSGWYAIGSSHLLQLKRYCRSKPFFRLISLCSPLLSVSLYMCLLSSTTALLSVARLGSVSRGQSRMSAFCPQYRQ